MREPPTRYQCVFDAASDVLKRRLPDLPEPDRLELATTIALRARESFNGAPENPDG